MVTFEQIGEQGTTVEITRFDRSVEAGTTGEVEFTVEVGDPDQSLDLDAEVKAFLYVNGENPQNIVASTSSVVSDDDILEGKLGHVFPESSGNVGYGEDGREDGPVWIKVTVDYFGTGGFSRGSIDEGGGEPTPTKAATSDDKFVKVTKPEEDVTVEQFGRDSEPSGDDTLSSTFRNRTPFSIKEIEYDDDANFTISKILFEDYPNPTVAIDKSGRFAKHEIIGGTTVRQKVGEDPTNISVNGVCKRENAIKIDALPNAKSGKLFSNRLPGNSDSIRVQFGSTSTEPLTDGGAADITDGQYLYTYQINAIEVIR